MSGDPLVDGLLLRAGAAARSRWPDAEVLDLRPLHGGISSLTFTASLVVAGEGRTVVLKVAPPGLEPVRNRDVLRQARVMRAARRAPGVRVPELLFEVQGAPPFFAMEFVAGESYEPRWDVVAAPPSPETVDARARAAARMLARLQAVAPTEIGLADEPALSLAEELARWTALYGTAGDELRGDEQSLARALRERMPAEPASGQARVLHGDYRLGNMLFDGDALTSLIDWEIWSVGDPRADLAWLLMFCDPVQQRVISRDAPNQSAADAMPTPRALLAEYLAVGESDPPERMEWFGAFCCYKLGAAMAVLAKRNRRLPEPDPGLELAAATAAPMLAHGLELLRSPDSDP